MAALNRAGQKRVTIISAPAGTGKTSLLRAWADQPGQDCRIAFTTVRPGQPDMQLFWLTVLGAIRAAAGTGEGGAQLPPVTPGSSSSAMVDKVLSELEESCDRFVLIIDDLHELSSPEAGGPAPAAAHLRAGPGQRRARRPAYRRHGFGTNPAGPRGRQRVRRVPRPRPYLVPLPPHVRRPAPAGTAPHDARRHPGTTPARRALARRARPGRRRHRPLAGGRRLGRGGPHAHRPRPQPHPRRASGHRGGATALLPRPHRRGLP
jgi:hypothetical protein